MAQPIAFGATFQISAQNANSQDQSSLALLRDGRVVVAWKDMGSNAGDIAYRLMHSGGTAASGERHANTGTIGLQARPSVAALSDGGFVMGWESFASDGNGDVVYRTFRSNGLGSIEAEVNVANDATGYQQDVSVVGMAAGGFVIGWNDGNTGTTGLGNSTAAMLREFSAAGLAGQITRVSGNWGGDYGPRLASRGDDLLAAWDDSLGPNTSQNGEDGIYASLITGGLPASHLTDGGTRMDQGTFREASMDPDVALTGLGSVVVWDDVTTGSDGRDIYLARDNGTVFRVNSTTGGTQSQAAVAALGGGFVVVWTDENALGERDVRARVYDASGQATSADFRVTAAGAGSAGVQSNPDVVALLDGRFMVSWSDEAADAGINGRIFDPRTAGQSWLGGAIGERYYGTAFQDSLRGGGGADAVFGMAGNDVLNGGTGADLLDGGAGRDVADYSSRTGGVRVGLNEGSLVDLRVGGVVEDQLRNIENIFGGQGHDRLLGDNLGNLFRGDAGNDTLDGGYGNDTLTGGAGADEFAFSTPRSASENLDRITDFVSGSDHLALVGGSYAALAGSVGAGELRYGTAAVDGNDRLIYDQATGRLWWDGNANAAGGAVLICRLQAGAVLQADDFLLR